jgi:uncharacterized membrane protein
MTPRFLFAFAVIVAAMLGGAAPASAALQLCNQTSYILYAAFGAATKAELDARGWSRIAPGDCATPIPQSLTAPAYFVYAHTSPAHSGPSRAWGGNVPICARDTNFALRNKLPVRACPGPEYYKMPFAVIDRHGRASWTTSFTESPDLKTLKDAKRAGIDRLLEDLGYHVNVPGERARDLALEDFHKRAKLAADASSGALFAALEIQAMKAAAPAGYTVCNNSEMPLWVAIALQASNKLSTRGWWQVARGACSRLITEPLRTDRVYLLAQSKGKPPLVTGPAKFCIEDSQFELSGKPACRGKGFSVAGFAATDTKGRSGYVAKIGDNGLASPASASAPTAAHK